MKSRAKAKIKQRARSLLGATVEIVGNGYWAGFWGIVIQIDQDGNHYVGAGCFGNGCTPVFSKSELKVISDPPTLP
jgi:Na+-transporting NADH:ubiquinone oxidoreductase subunit NqrC